jgi:hypothetical protein
MQNCSVSKRYAKIGQERKPVNLCARVQHCGENACLIAA